MDFVTFIALVVTTIAVAANFHIEEINGQKYTTEKKLFEVDQKKIQQYWQFATTNGLIKAYTKSILQNMPRIERVVFNQCASDARTVVDLARCSIRVFDAKENLKISPPTTTKSPSFIPMMRFNIRPRNQQLQVAASDIVQEHGSTSTENSLKYYYSSIKKLWVPNPIKKQIKKTRRIKRDDMMEAYELFLQEQRNIKKAQDRKNKQESTEQNSRNVYGLPRFMKMSNRTRREIQGADFERNSENIDYQKLLTKYFRYFTAGGMSKKDEGTNLENIRRIRDHYIRTEKCNKYFKLMNDENKKFFEVLKLGIYSDTPKINANEDALNNIMELINSFSASNLSQEKLSVLSPRLFSIMPEGRGKNRLLSPTILSFHKDGFFSLPDIFEIVSSNQRYQHIMLEAILDLSGAGAAIEQLIAKIEPDMKFMEEVQYPLIQKMSSQDVRWLKAQRSFTTEQQEDYEKFNLVHLNEEQVRLIYPDNPEPYLKIAKLSTAEREQRIEESIRKLAKEGMPQWPFWNTRVKREESHDDGSHDIPNYPEEEKINNVSFITLKPHAFANLINFGVSMEALILSPHAFVSEIMHPETLKLDVLSPRAFVATVLSPSALLARILSPTAFRAEVLSPRALTAWVLSPEALVAEVLSPRFLEPRVLSPEALVIDVLSPGILSPHVLSSETYGVMILSPNILSPRIASDEKFIVEVLSPHILGGPHSKEEEKSNVEIGGGEHEGHGENEEHGGHARHNHENNLLFEK